MNRPDVNEFDASVGVTYGQTEHSDGDNVAIDGMVNIPLSDTAAFRLSAGSVENEGVVDYVNLYQLQDGKPVVLSDSGECLSVNDSSLTNEELAFNESCYTSKKDADDVSIYPAQLSVARGRSGCAPHYHDGSRLLRQRIQRTGPERLDNA
jgi:hypothetical protein